MLFGENAVPNHQLSYSSTSFEVKIPEVKVITRNEQRTERGGYWLKTYVRTCVLTWGSFISRPEAEVGRKQCHHAAVVGSISHATIRLHAQ